MVDTLISDIYSAAAGRLDWQKPLDEVAVRLGLWGVQIIGLDKQTGGLIFSAEGGPGRTNPALDYLRFFHRINPRIAPSVATPIDKWMHCHEYFDDTYVAKSPFYQDFLIPYGGRYLSSTKLIDSSDVIFMFGVLRGNDSYPIGEDDIPLLMQLKHHFTEAFHNFVYLRETYAEIGMARQLLAQFDYPMLLLDEARGIWHRNESATKLLQTSPVVTDKNGFLVCMDRASNDLLTEAIHSLCLSGKNQEIKPHRRVVPISKLSSEGRHPLLAFVSALYPDDAMGAFGHMARALIIFHDTGDANYIADPLIVAECFDLTPAEARVAIHILNGANAKEIASKTKIEVPTVRTHIQRLMKKLGVARQTDLIRVLLAMPLLK